MGQVESFFGKENCGQGPVCNTVDGAHTHTDGPKAFDKKGSWQKVDMLPPPGSNYTEDLQIN